MGGIFLLDEIFAVEQLFAHGWAAFLEDRPAARGEVAIPHFIGHFLARSQRRQVQAAEPGDLAPPIRVQGVVLRTVDDAVFACIFLNEEFQRFFNLGPKRF